jgi:type I restriction enzyme, S subunit
MTAQRVTPAASISPLPRMGEGPGVRALPRGWRWTTLGDLFVIQQGVAMSPARRDAKPTRPFLRTLNIAWGGVDLSELDEMHFSEDEVMRLALRDGDLLICEGGDVGRTAIWRSEIPLCLHQNHVHRLRAKDRDLVPEVFMYWMQFALAVGRYAGQWGETTIPNLSASRLAAFEVPLPPLAEQRRIAAILRDQLDIVRRAREAALARMEAARALPAALLRSVFASEEARQWPRLPLGEACSIRASQVDPKMKEYRDLPHVSGENIESGTGRLLPLHTAAEDGMISGKYLFEKGDVLYSKLRPYLRKVALATEQGLCSADMYPLRPNPGVDSRWLAAVLLSEGFTRYADEESKRVRMPKLNRDQVFAWPAPMPPTKAQKSLAREAFTGIAGSLELTAITAGELSSVNALPQSLLRQAFAGEL